MKKSVLLLFLSFTILLALTSCSTGGSIIKRFYLNSFTESVPDTVVIDGITYRNGFYGNLWSKDLTYQTDSYKVGRNEFFRVNCEQFDWVHSSIGDRTSGVLYCADDQWEQAHRYYSDSNNFIFHCFMESNYEVNMDLEKLNELLDFAEKNGYNPFTTNKNAKTQRLPMPDKFESPEIVFYCESNDGFFTSYRGNKFYIINDKLFLEFQYDCHDGAYEEMVAVEVPDQLGKYFIDIVKEINGV